MTSYEIFLLMSAFATVLTILSLASVAVENGSIRIAATCLLIAVGAGWLADKNSENGANPYDVGKILHRVINDYYS